MPVKLPLKPEKPKRIPKGSIVKWRARYANDPLNEGIVMELPKNNAVFHAPRYIVKCTKVDGKELKKPKKMSPYAKGLEYQNADLLQKQ